MFRPAVRCLARQPLRTVRPRATRNLSTAPPHTQSRSWTNSAARWTLAAGAVYYYNTSTLFAEEPIAFREGSPEDEDLPTLSSLSPSSRLKPPHPEDRPSIAPTPTTISPPSIDPKAPEPAEPSSAAEPGSPQALEEEAGQQGAFNEETGEINWDCPCLGGMAHGPCGPEFREAFSCFIFSKEEPKGVDCIENFKGMQNCFREHPEIYGAELDDDEDADLAVAEEGAQVAGALPDDAPGVAAGQAIAKEEAEHVADSASTTVQRQTTPASASGTTEGVTEAVKQRAAELKQKAEESVEDLSARAASTKEQVVETTDKLKERVDAKLASTDAKATTDETDVLVPKAAHDATGQNEK